MDSLRRWLAAALVLTAVAGAEVGGGMPAGATSPTDRCYIGALHEVFLGRAATVYDLEAWADRYEPEPARPALPRAMAGSDEWLEAVVVGVYDAALDRGPDADGLAFWVEQLRGGARVATLTARVYGSAEVWERAGSTPEGFVADVFPRIMGRAATPDDVDYWAGEVGTRGRGGVAKALVGSIENRRARVTRLYVDILGRQPDPAGRDYWVGRLARLDDVQLAVQLASSAEAYDEAQDGCSVPPEPTTTPLTDGSGPSRAPQISDDGRWIAFTSIASDLVPGDQQDAITDLFLIDRMTGTTTKVTDGGSSVGEPTISADGRHVAFPTGSLGNRDIFTWERETGTLTRITDADSESGEPSISADGRWIAFTSEAALVAGDEDDDEDVYLWDRTTGTTELVSPPEIPRAMTPQLSADGQRLAFHVRGLGDTSIVLWERGGGDLIPVAEDNVVAFDIGADGEVLYGRPNRTRSQLLLWDPDTGTTRAIFTGDNATTGADLSADGATVAFATFANGLFPGDRDDSPNVFVWERATGTIAHIGVVPSDGSSPTTTADGRLVAYHAREDGIFSDAQITVWDRGS